MPEIAITVDEPNQPDIIELTTGIMGPPGPPGPQGPPVLRGAWSPITTYQPDDVVTRNGSTWLATVENTGIDPTADPSKQVVGQMTYTSPLALGSPQSVASGFTVDRDTFVVAVSVGQSWTGATTGVGKVGIADAINVPAIGISWLGQGSIGPLGRVELNQMVTLSAGVRYWLCMDDLPTANVQIDQGPEIVGTHMAWSGEFWYGGSEPTGSLGTYGLASVLYGTTGDDAWQLFVARGDPAPVKVMTQAEYDALPVKDPDTVYVVT